ncbi:MAG: LuxR C-terminal-related transcriptional regulator [Burkholderiaceae bacterium]
MSSATIMIVDDNDAFRRSLIWMLEGLGHRALGFASGEEFLAFWQGDGLLYRRAIVLLDVRMCGLSGLDVHRRLLEQANRPIIITMSGHGDIPMAVEAMSLGALTFIEKPFAEGVLVAALAKATQLLDSKPAPVGNQGTPAEEFARRLGRLTPREREVLELVVDGQQNKQIADRLGISIKTVELHRSRVMQKMQAGSVIALVRMMVSGVAH